MAHRSVPGEGRVESDSESEIDFDSVQGNSDSYIIAPKTARVFQDKQNFRFSEEKPNQEVNQEVQQVNRNSTNNKPAHGTNVIGSNAQSGYGNTSNAAYPANAAYPPYCACGHGNATSGYGNAAPAGPVQPNVGYGNSNAAYPAGYGNSSYNSGYGNNASYNSGYRNPNVSYVNSNPSLGNTVNTGMRTVPVGNRNKSSWNPSVICGLICCVFIIIACICIPLVGFLWFGWFVKNRFDDHHSRWNDRKDNNWPWN